MGDPVIEIPTDLPSEVVPLSWLIGEWEGKGVIEYLVDDEVHRHEFHQRVSFRHDGMPYLTYTATATLLGHEATPEPLTSEMGYWRVSRTHIEGDQGPGMLPGVGPRPFTTAESVETLRASAGGFPVDVQLVHPTGVSELYVGTVEGPRINLSTDAVVRTAGAKEYSAATRMYGFVNGNLMWAWDIAALGQELRTHASAELERVSEAAANDKKLAGSSEGETVEKAPERELPAKPDDDSTEA